jgi:hypothetical protein
MTNPDRLDRRALNRATLRSQIERDGAALLAFLHPRDAHDVRIS